MLPSPAALALLTYWLCMLCPHVRCCVQFIHLLSTYWAPAVCQGQGLEWGAQE